MLQDNFYALQLCGFEAWNLLLMPVELETNARLAKIIRWDTTGYSAGSKYSHNSFDTSLSNTNPSLSSSQLLSSWLFVMTVNT